MVSQNGSQSLARSLAYSLAPSFTHFRGLLVVIIDILAELVRLLLEKGASLEARNKDKATPLDSSHNKQVCNTEYKTPVVLFLH